MTRSPGMRAAFILRRMRHYRLLIACIVAAIVIITALVTALANFAARALPAAAMQQLTSARGTAIAVNSSSTPSEPGPPGQLIATSMRHALAGVPFGLQRATWSDPLNLPSPPDGGAIWTAQVAAMEGITAHARLVAGSWPASPHAGQAVGVAIPVADARPLGMAVGQTLRLDDGDNQRLALLRVTGLYQVVNPGSDYWGLDLLPPAGVSVQTGFRTYGPFIAQPGAFTVGGLTPGQLSWLVTPAVARIQAAKMPGTASRVQLAIGQMSQSELQVSTSLPELLSGIATSYQVSRSLLAMSALELLLVAAAALALTARLLASQRTDETALMESRGLTRRQLALLSVAEALLLVALAAATGAAIGNWVADSLDSAGILRADRQHLAGAGVAAWWPAAAVAALALLILAWPAIMPGAASNVTVRRGRQPAVALATRAGLDLALIALAVVTGWQLRRYSVIARSASGSLGLDPVLIAAPPLILIGAALIPLRLVPALARLGDRLSARGRRLIAALATWEISRQPVRQAGPALLAILAVGTGTLALAQQQSWTDSIHDQAAAAVGADVRVSLLPPASLPNSASVLGGHAVTAAMPVSEFDGGLGGPVIALEARTAARVVLLRRDQAGRPTASLWRMIAPTARRPGIAIPGRPYRLAVLARLSAVAADADLGPLQVTVTVQAADGVGYDLPAGALRADGRDQVLTAVIPAPARVAGSLRLVGITAGYQLPGYPGPSHSAAAALAAGTLTAARAALRVQLAITGFAAAPAPAGVFPPPFAAGAALDPWQRGAGSSTLSENQDASGQQPVILSWQPADGSGRTLTFRPGYGHLITKPGNPPLAISATLTLAAPAGHAAALPAIATDAFLGASGDVVGGSIVVAVGSYHIPVTIVAAIRSFPTAGQDGALIVDQSSVQAALASQSAPSLPVTGWWLSTPSGRVPAGIPAGQVTSLRQVTAQMLANPLTAAPQRAVLALIIAVALLALLGFCVSVAASISERRARTALLAALGVTRTAQARQLCLEQLLLALPAAAVGLLVGAAIAHLLVPAITITNRATLPVPPALVYVPAGWAITLAALVAVAPVLVAAITVLRRPDPAGELRAAGTT
jgi:hypothetical protein